MRLELLPLRDASAGSRDYSNEPKAILININERATGFEPATLTWEAELVLPFHLILKPLQSKLICTRFAHQIRI